MFIEITISLACRTVSIKKYKISEMLVDYSSGNQQKSDFHAFHLFSCETGGQSHFSNV